MTNIILLGIGLAAGISISWLYFIFVRRLEAAERAVKESAQALQDLREQLDGRQVPYKFRRRLEDNLLGLDFIRDELRRIWLYHNQEADALKEIDGMADKLSKCNMEERRTK